jgi:hypothetical protein
MAAGRRPVGAGGGHAAGASEPVPGGDGRPALRRRRLRRHRVAPPGPSRSESVRVGLQKGSEARPAEARRHSIFRKVRTSVQTLRPPFAGSQSWICPGRPAVVTAWYPHPCLGLTPPPPLPSCPRWSATTRPATSGSRCAAWPRPAPPSPQRSSRAPSTQASSCPAKPRQARRPVPLGGHSLGLAAKRAS